MRQRVITRGPPLKTRNQSGKTTFAQPNQFAFPCGSNLAGMPTGPASNLFPIREPVQFFGFNGRLKKTQKKKKRCTAALAPFGLFPRQIKRGDSGRDNISRLLRLSSLVSIRRLSAKNSALRCSHCGTPARAVFQRNPHPKPPYSGRSTSAWIFPGQSPTVEDEKQGFPVLNLHAQPLQSSAP